MQGENLKLKIKNHNVAGQYECQADNGINEKQSKIITVNVNGMSVDSMNFALKILNYFWYKMWSWNQYFDSDFWTKTLLRHC